MQFKCTAQSSSRKRVNFWNCSQLAFWVLQKWKWIDNFGFASKCIYNEYMYVHSFNAFLPSVMASGCTCQIPICKPVELCKYSQKVNLLDSWKETCFCLYSSHFYSNFSLNISQELNNIHRMNKVLYSYMYLVQQGNHSTDSPPCQWTDIFHILAIITTL